MAGEKQLGNIVYEVEMDVQKLLEAQQKVNSRLDAMEERFDETSRAVAGTEKSFSSLTKVASALTAALSVQQVAHYADAWTTLNNKLSNSIRTGEQLIDVTERVFNITQSTRSSLDATATLYARLERGTREYNTSAADLAKLTTIINQGFVVSGATAQEAENAIIQLSQGIASGVLRGEEYNSVSEQGSRLMVALADSLGVGIGQLRAMAAQGKLTTDVVVNGLLSQGDAIGREFANTTQTISQAFQTAGNNITKFVGSSTTVKAGVAIFNSAVVTLSENLDVVSTAVLAITAVMGSRYVAALVLATQKQIALAASAYSAATAQGALAAASAGLRGAMSLVGGPAGVATLAAAAIFYFYQRAQQAKQEANDLADGVGSLVVKFKEMSATELGASLARMRESLGSLTDSVDDAQAVYDKATSRVSDLRKEIDNWGTGTKRGRQASDALSGAMDNQYLAAAALEKAQNRLSQTQSAITIGQAQLTTGVRTGIDLLSRESTAVADAAGMMNHFAKAIGLATTEKQRFNATSLTISRPKDIQDYLDGQQEQIDLQSEFNERKRAQLKAEQDIRNLAAKGDSSNAEQIERDVKLARERAGVTFDQQKAEEARNKTQQQGEQQDKRSATAAESVTQKLENLRQQSELSADSTREMSREQAILTAQQSLGAAATQKDLQLAGQYAAKKWDSAAAIRAQAAALKMVPEEAENASYKQDAADLKTALDLKKVTQEQYNAASEQLEQEHQVRLSKIRAQQATANPLAEARAEIDPVTALANQNAQKLALMSQYYQQEQAALVAARQQNALTEDQYQQQKLATDAQYQALINAQNTQYEQQRTDALWTMLSQQGLGYNMLTSAVDAFAGNASNAITGLITGSMSASEALRSLGSTMLNSVVNSLVQVGVEALKNFIIGQTIGAASVAAGVGQAAALSAAWATPAALASLASFGANAGPAQAGMISTVGLGNTLALAGARKNGGPVSAGSMYQVGENGMPEIYQASNGSQYMIPGDNGKVLSNRDITGSGGITIINNVENYSSGAMVDMQASSDGNGNVTIQTIVTDIANGGQIGRAISTYHNAPRRAIGG